MTTSTLHPPAKDDLSPSPSGLSGPSDPAGPSGRSTGGSTGDANRRAHQLRAISVVGLLVATATLLLWNLSASGYANSFYSAAVQAGSQSWKAFFFGSLDAGNSITVDKPPASLWLMALSVRIFGLSSWSILAPQALLGVATVGVLYATVRRTSGHVAGLVAGALLALTPVATLMFRFNNPDALLVFLLTFAAYATLRATEKASARWLVGAGVLVGFAFLTKMLQAFLVLPAFALVYLIAAPTPVRRRILHLLAAFAAMIASLGWWVAIVELVPASWRPYIGGSETNSVLDLVFGYNGLGRILGNSAGGAGGGGSSFGSVTGWTRLFAGVSGGMVSWLIPAALVLGAIALLIARRAPRTSAERAAVIVWGGLAGRHRPGLLLHGRDLPRLLHRRAGPGDRRARRGRRGPGLAAAYDQARASRAGGRHRGQRTLGLASARVGHGPVRDPALARADRRRRGRARPVDRPPDPTLVASIVLALALLAATTGPAAYALNTAATAHTGSIVTAGPVSSTGFGGGPGGARTGRHGGDDPACPQGGQAGQPQDGDRAASSEVIDLLSTDSSAYTWAAATSGSQSAASYQLATGLPVMAIGGFNGGDPSPTLEQFQAYVADGEIHYYLGGGGRVGAGAAGGGRAARAPAPRSHRGWRRTSPRPPSAATTVYDLTAAP